MSTPESEPGQLYGIAPLESRLVRRAAEFARRDQSDEIRLSHLLQALVGRPITPALEQHLLRAAETAEDDGYSTVTDTHLLLAVLDSDCLARSVVAAVTSVESLVTELRATLNELSKEAHVARQNDIS